MYVKRRSKFIAGVAVFLAIIAVANLFTEFNIFGTKKPYNVMAREIIEERDPYSKRYLNEDGTITAKISMSPVHYKNTNGGYEDIDLSIRKEKNGSFEYASEKNTFRTYFNASDSLEEYNTAKFDLVNNQGKIRSVVYKLPGAAPEGHSYKDRKFKYINVFRDIDLEYIVSSERLKENVIVKKPLEKYRFKFLLELDEDVYLEELENGDVNFIDAETSEVLWKIEKPYAEDSSEEKLYTENVRYEFRNENHNGREYTGITLILEDEEFLRKAKFPVIIDPTGSVNDSNAKTWSFGAEAADEENSYLKVGYNKKEDGYWCFGIKYNFSLGSDITVNSAELRLYMKSRSIKSDPEEKLNSVFNLYMIEHDWNENSPMPMTGEIIKYKQPFYDFKVDAVNSIDITKAVQSWVSKANQSFGILAKPASSNYTYCSFSKSSYGDIVINYSEPLADGTPKAKMLSPVKNQIVSGTFTPKIFVADANKDMLTCKCFIDNETTARSTKTVPSLVGYTGFAFDPIDISSLQMGPHTLRFEISDGKSSPVYLSETFNKAGMKYESSISSIKLAAFGMTNKDSFDSYSYKYTIGSITSGETTRNEHFEYNLTPNTQYASKLEFFDGKGNSTVLTQNIYTKAQTPQVGISKISDTSFDIYVTDTNPSGTEYLITVNGKYVTSSGGLSDGKVWIGLANRKITISGLSKGTLYNIKVKARNKENIETPFGNQTSATTLK
ncbi:MAG: DNRLRE domain-containing protein [Clostridiaceae bacterium]|nr:DNRLRE domain-containing protein [Clostridiaceae bacterium]